MLDRLEQIETRYEDLGRQLADPQLVTDQQKYHKTAKAHRDLEAIVGKYRELKQAQQGIADATSMLSESDAELAAMAQEELTRLQIAAERAAALRRTARSQLPAAAALALRQPVLTARGLAERLRLSPQAALILLKQLVAAEMLREATGRTAWRAFVVA